MSASQHTLPITDRAAEVLRPELEYRLRFLIQEALKIAKHANRRTVLPQDLVFAYNSWCRAKTQPFVFVAHSASRSSSATGLLPSSTCSISTQPITVYRSLYELLG
jgi:hypothetical protein